MDRPRLPLGCSRTLRIWCDVSHRPALSGPGAEFPRRWSTRCGSGATSRTGPARCGSGATSRTRRRSAPRRAGTGGAAAWVDVAIALLVVLGAGIVCGVQLLQLQLPPGTDPSPGQLLQPPPIATAVAVARDRHDLAGPAHRGAEPARRPAARPRRHRRRRGLAAAHRADHAGRRSGRRRSPTSCCWRCSASSPNGSSVVLGPSPAGGPGRRWRAGRPGLAARRRRELGRQPRSRRRARRSPGSPPSSPGAAHRAAARRARGRPGRRRRAPRRSGHPRRRARHEPRRQWRDRGRRVVGPGGPTVRRPCSSRAEHGRRLAFRGPRTAPPLTSTATRRMARPVNRHGISPG